MRRGSRPGALAPIGRTGAPGDRPMNETSSAEHLSALDAPFRPIYGLPCWNVWWGWGSFLAMEFGEPRLEIREPRSSPELSPRVRRHLARRLVTLRGEWRLSIHCCQWYVYTGDTLIGDADLEGSTKR